MYFILFPIIWATYLRRLIIFLLRAYGLKRLFLNSLLNYMISIYVTTTRMVPFKWLIRLRTKNSTS